MLLLCHGESCEWLLTCVETAALLATEDVLHAEPQWGSLSRGLLLCDECCSVHRSLGPHVSRVRHLHRASWAPAQLSMVHSLHASGANAIWEHQLLEPGKAAGRRKPSARDSLHPIKSEFIRAKHQNLAFVHRVAKEGEQPTQEDLSKQLHASVRTANLETSLRLLAQGALPSHLHPDKGSTALHVAARSGQACQVELLLVYGADPTARDSQGMTPADCAREAGHADLEARLIESQYEVTDRLAHHLSGRNPEHHLGQHFILPEMADCLDLSAHARAAKYKLQSLPERLFVELARDLYDEVDRRECEAVWLGGGASLVGADRQAVPFLPVSPELSSTRNQARQKLARLTAREFATLLIDVLSEAKRRHLGAKQPGWEEHRLSDDEPLYDSVASDEDNNATTWYVVQTTWYSIRRMGKQLWQRVSELQREHAAMRLDLEAVQATLAAMARQPLSPQGTSSPQALRSPRPQSMCEWRHLTGATGTPRTCVHELPGRHMVASLSHGEHEGDGTFCSLPTYQEVLAQTENITRCIHKLLACAQGGNRDAFLPCTQKILQAVLGMGSLFGGGQQPPGGAVSGALARLVGSAQQLERWASNGLEGGQLIQGAYEVAKGTKELVQAYPATPPP
ncbi:ARF GTPase-activating protein GIT2 isoform X3 [Dermacentor albipictus]|uniref:ARF GTPase-activating protein GIT2 isoform X3 n=1 Tax=Dermacentor albipictus TaxID=60249 RepID=UPI0038FCF998